MPDRLTLFCFLLMLIPAPILGQQVTDQMGFYWDFATGGSINDGSDDAFDGGIILQVDGAGFDGSGQGVKQDDLYVFGAQTLGDVTVTRHVLVVEDPPGLVYADSFTNSSNETTKCLPVIHSDFGEAATPQVKANDQGKMSALLYMHQPNRPLIAFHFGEPDTPYLPTLSGSGDIYQFSFPQLELKPGETKSIGYFVGQRRPGTGQATFSDEEAFRKSILQINKKKAFAFVNLPGYGLYNTGKLKLIDRASSDYIATLKKDRVYGKLLTQEFHLETVVGTRKYKAEEIVNAVRFDSEKYAIAADDGSILEGKLTPEKVKFELSDGGQGEIELKNIEVLVPKEPDLAKAKKRKRGQWFEFKAPVFAFVSQDRLTGTPLTESLKVHTSIGVLNVPFKSIQTIEMEQGKSQQQPQFAMVDGQSFTGFLYDDIEVKIFDGSTMKISPKNLTAVFMNGQIENNRKLPADHAYLRLDTKGYLLIEFLTDQKPMEFTSLFGTQTINPEQVLTLESSPGLAAGANLTLWDGSKLQGKLTGKNLMVKVLGKEREIAIEMIREFHNPMAMPPAPIRKKYLELIKLLDSKKYAERAGAYKVLDRDKEKLRGLFKSQLDKVGPEAKSRLWKLLPESDRPKQAKRPSVKKMGGKAEPAKPE